MMDTDPSVSPGETLVRVTRQTTLDEDPKLGPFISWLRRPPAHAKPLQSKAEGPSSGAKDMTVEPVTLADWSGAWGDVEDRGNQ